jgi:hypothetical protein
VLQVSGPTFAVISFIWQTILLASKTPAQIKPVDVTVTEVGSAEVYVTVGVGVMAVPLEFSTATLTLATSPWLSERLVGVAVIVVGVFVVFVDLLPPQDASTAVAPQMRANRVTRKRRM